MIHDNIYCSFFTATECWTWLSTWHWWQRIIKGGMLWEVYCCHWRVNFSECSKFFYERVVINLIVIRFLFVWPIGSFLSCEFGHANSEIMSKSSKIYEGSLVKSLIREKEKRIVLGRAFEFGRIVRWKRRLELVDAISMQRACQHSDSVLESRFQFVPRF